MTSKDRLAGVLEAILDRLDASEARAERYERKLDEVIQVAVERAAEVDTLRTRAIEQASRDGEDRRRDRKALIELEARVARAERGLHVAR